MGYWIREVVGWIFILAGLYGFWIALAFLATQPSRLIEGGTTSIMATVLFRGGLQLVRISAAARVVLNANPPSTVPSSTSSKKSDRGNRTLS